MVEPLVGPAVGVMQVLPSTAASPPISIPDVEKLEPNIKAGVKLLKYVRDDYFRDDPMDPLNKTLITLAAYHAGPARLKQCRRMTANMCLNPNVWFQNVEYAMAEKVGTETVTYAGKRVQILSWLEADFRAGGNPSASKEVGRRRP